MANLSTKTHTKQQIREKMKEFENIDKLTDLALGKLSNTVTLTERQALRSLIAQLSGLKLTAAGTVKPSKENIKKIQDIIRQLNTIMIPAPYKEAINAFVENYLVIDKLLLKYFIGITPDAKSALTTDVYKFYTQQAIDNTVSQLAGVGAQAQYVEPIKGILSKAVGGGMTYDGIITEIEALLISNEETKSIYRRYVTQVSADAIMQYERNYIIKASETLGLNKYLYSGGVISDTRDFCAERSGKYYTDEEVKSWASLQWQGRIKGTNSENIFTYLGGYNCRHRLIPVLDDKK